MSDEISRIKIINPTYPVRPTSRPENENAPEERKRELPKRKSDDDPESDDKHSIDEYI